VLEFNLWHATAELKWPARTHFRSLQKCRVVETHFSVIAVGQTCTPVRLSLCWKCVLRRCPSVDIQGTMPFFGALTFNRSDIPRTGMAGRFRKSSTSSSTDPLYGPIVPVVSVNNLHVTPPRSLHFFPNECRPETQSSSAKR
jgi:hypothetical protein